MIIKHFTTITGFYQLITFEDLYRKKIRTSYINIFKRLYLIDRFIEILINFLRLFSSDLWFLNSNI